MCWCVSNDKTKSGSICYSTVNQISLSCNSHYIINDVTTSRRPFPTPPFPSLIALAPNIDDIRVM